MREMEKKPRMGGELGKVMEVEMVSYPELYSAEVQGDKDRNILLHWAKWKPVVTFEVVQVNGDISRMIEFEDWVTVRWDRLLF